VYSVWGGWKLSCTSLLSSSDNTGRRPCPTRSVSLSPSLCVQALSNFALSRKGLHNITHPRTDAVVIVAVLNESQDKILLGRKVSRTSSDYHGVSLIFWKLETVPSDVLLHPGRLHRTRRIVRGCRQTRSLGGSWDPCPRREISLRTAMGSLTICLPDQDSHPASLILPISWLGFMRSEIP